MSYTDCNSPIVFRTTRRHPIQKPHELTSLNNNYKRVDGKIKNYFAPERRKTSGRTLFIKKKYKLLTGQNKKENFVEYSCVSK